MWIRLALLALAVCSALLLLTVTHYHSYHQQADQNEKDSSPIRLKRSAETVANGSTSLQRSLPQAIIIGVKKGGTRALLEYLRIHPDVRAPGPEMHFFDRYYDRGIDWYRRQMPLTSPGQLTIEKTPGYWIKKEVPKRIFEMSPHTKLIVVVRDPVTRAISDFTQSSSKKHSKKKFEEMAFSDTECTTVDAGWGAIKIGLYDRQLRKWLPYFPVDQMMFVSGEQLITNPLAELREVEKFLGLRPHLTKENFHFNSAKGFPCIRRHVGAKHLKCLGRTKGRRHPTVSKESLETLKNFFAPHNQHFYQLVDRDFGWDS